MPRKQKHFTTPVLVVVALVFALIMLLAVYLLVRDGKDATAFVAAITALVPVLMLVLGKRE